MPMKREEKRKKSKNTDTSTSIPKEPVNNEMPGTPQPSRGPADQWITLILLGSALYLLSKDNRLVAYILLAGALWFLVKQNFPSVRFPWARKFFDGVQKIIDLPSHWKGPLLLLLTWVAFSLGIMTFPSFTWLYPNIRFWPFQQSFGMLLIFWVGMIVSFRLLPKENSQTDISPSTARFWFWAAIILAAFLRFYHFPSTIGAYWDDQAMEVMDVRYAHDFGNFTNFFIIPNGAREPLYSYFMYFLWMLLPNATSMVIQRLAGGLLDLMTVITVYYLGKELVNRRMGVLAVMLAAVSQALVVKSMAGFRIFTMGLGMALALLFFFRVARKPTLANFLLWGAAVAFGAYTYGTFHPVVVFFVFWAWIWVWFQQRGVKNQDRTVLVISWTSTLLLAVYFLYVNNVLPHGLWFVRILDVTNSLLPCLLLGLFFVFVYKAFPKTALDNKNSMWLNWTAGSWLCAILSFPMMANTEILSRMQSSILPSANATGVSFWGMVQELMRVLFYLLFLGGGDRSDLMRPGDSIFGFTEVALIALGLAWAVARPNWTKIVLVLSAIVGFAPFILTRGPHSGRASACIVPFLLLGALGLEGFLAGLSQVFKRRLIMGMAYILLLVLGGWTAWGTFTSVYDRWWGQYGSKHTLTQKLGLQDMAQGDRVYVSTTMTGRTAQVLFENHPAYYMNPGTNIIYVGPDEKVPNVVVYLEPDSADVKDQLHNLFPTAQWTDLHFVFEPNMVPAMRCFIPLADLYAAHPEQFDAPATLGPAPPALPQTLLLVHRVTGPYWERQYSPSINGFTFGVLDWEDKVSNATDPTYKPFDISGYVVKYRGVIHVNAGGKYDITMKTPNRTIVRVDNRKIFDLKYFNDQLYFEPPRDEKTGLYLEAGDHPVEVITCDQRSAAIPDIVLQRRGSPGAGQSLWSTYNF
jgi:uncharacterized membrane protein